MKGLFILALVATCGAYNLPSYLKQCNARSDDFARCIVDQIPTIRPYLKDGIEEINLPPLAPYKVSELNITTANNKIFTLRDVNVYHMVDVQMLVLELDAKESFAKYKFFFKKLEIDGHNQGCPVKIKIYDLDFDFSFYYVPAITDGVLYMEFHDKQTVYKSGTFHIEIDGFNDDYDFEITDVSQAVGGLVDTIFTGIIGTVPAKILYDFS